MDTVADGSGFNQDSVNSVGYVWDSGSTRELTASANVEPAEAFWPNPTTWQESDEVSDDSVHMYMREIARVPLLTADEERLLAGRIERGRYIQEAGIRCSRQRRQTLPAVDLTVYIVGHVLAAFPLLDVAREHLHIDSALTPGALLQVPEFRTAIDNAFTPDLVAAVKEATNRTAQSTYEALVSLSVGSGVLPPRATDLLVAESAERLNQLVVAERGRSLLRRYEHEFHRHYDEVKQRALDAESHLIQANLRLVAGIAREYTRYGVPVLDLIQEGTIGLMRAVQKFNHRKGYRFSTYATWWVRQFVARGIVNQARTIRIPVHMVERMNRVLSAMHALSRELQYDPSYEEIGLRVDMSADKVEEIISLFHQEPASLETPVGEDGETELGELVADVTSPTPTETAAHALLKEQIDDILDQLTPREKRVLQLRYGLNDGYARSLAEVGQEFHLTRERIRQIEARALRKLRHPNLSQPLRDYLDQ